MTSLEKKPTIFYFLSIAIGLALALLIFEIVLRIFPWGRQVSPMPIIWQDDLGWIYKPNSKFTATLKNHWRTLYRSEQKANSLGFVDAELPHKWPSDGLRVLILGDSFVEALQVPLEQKMGRLLESKLAKRLNKPVHVISIGMSGLGQANQLAYWRRFKDRIKPHVVIAVVVPNDLRDNDARINGYINHWHALHAPRIGYTIRAKSGEVIELPLDNNWSLYQPKLLHNKPDAIWSYAKSLAFLARQFGWLPNNEKRYLFENTQIDLAFFDPKTRHHVIIKSSLRINESVFRLFSQEIQKQSKLVFFYTGINNARLSQNFFTWYKVQMQKNKAVNASVYDRIKDDNKLQTIYLENDGHFNAKGHRLAAEIIFGKINEVLP